MGIGVAFLHTWDCKELSDTNSKKGIVQFLKARMSPAHLCIRAQGSQPLAMKPSVRDVGMGNRLTYSSGSEKYFRSTFSFAVRFRPSLMQDLGTIFVRAHCGAVCA